MGLTMRKIIPYNPNLVELAKKLRNNMTMGEITLWREIKGKTLEVRFNRQIPIDQYIVDFYCKDLEFAIKVDGSIHFEDRQQEKDAIRQKRLEELGVVIIRFSDLDVKNNLSWVFLEIEKTIKNIKPSPKLTKEGIIYSYD